MEQGRYSCKTLQNSNENNISNYWSTDPREIVVGIDLGTINTIVACYLKKKIKILESCDGNNIVPSVVLFSNSNQTLIGSKAIINDKKTITENGIYEIKRLIGQKFENKDFQKNVRNLLYTVDDYGNEPSIVLQDSKELCLKTPVEIYSLLLLKIKYDIEETLGNLEKVKAVITVPAHFNIKQREATLEAAEQAGFEILQLLSEPSAIALRYFFKNQQYLNTRYFLVFNLGGGFFDAVIFKKTEKNIETVAVAGDSFLGGKDFDNVLIKHVCGVLISKYNFDPNLNKTILQKLQNMCEKTKNYLTSFEQCELNLEEIIPNLNMCTITITKIQFENLTTKLFEKLQNIVKYLLTENNLSKNHIKKVFLSGGATRIPKIQRLLEGFFGKKKIKSLNHLIYNVAEGAAIQAAMLSKSKKQKISMITVSDVIP